MIFEIRCTVCNEFIGTLSKPVITAQDILEYQQSVTCSLGHSIVSEEPEQEE